MDRLYGQAVLVNRLLVYLSNTENKLTGVQFHKLTFHKGEGCQNLLRRDLMALQAQIRTYRLTQQILLLKGNGSRTLILSIKMVRKDEDCKLLGSLPHVDEGNPAMERDTGQP